MRKYLWVFSLFLFCVSCGKQEEITDTIIPQKNPILEKIFPLLKDTTGFDEQSMGAQSSSLAFIKNGKLWIGLFNDDLSELIEEWNSSFELPKEAKKIVIGIPGLIKMDTGYACVVFLHNTTNITFSGSVIESFVLYLNDDSMHVSYKLEDPNIWDFNWGVYGDILLFRYQKELGGDENSYLSYMGEIIASQVTLVEDGNSLFFTGLADEKLRVFVSDKEGRAITSWNSATPIDMILKIHQGYGEYKTYEADSIRLGNILTMRWGYVAYAAFLSKGRTIKEDVLILNDQGGINRYEKKKSDSDIRYYSWYEESVLLCDLCDIDDNSLDSCFVISPKGENIKSFYSPYLSRHLGWINYEPISYEEAICLRGNWDDLALFCLDLSRSDYKWVSPIKVLQENMQRDAVLTVSIENKSGNLWKYKCDILYYNGDKKQVKFSVDIETGEVFP